MVKAHVFYMHAERVCEVQYDLVGVSLCTHSSVSA